MGKVPDEWRNVYNFAAGGLAGAVARTVIAPIERVKIIYQIGRAGSGTTGYIHLISKVIREGGGGLQGVAAFWKGNSVAVVRVYPYLGVQLASNEYFKRCLATFGPSGAGVLNAEGVRFFAGGGAGMTAVLFTYPLDLARARMALLMEQGAKEVPGMLGTMKEVYLKEGSARALYSGAGISMKGAALYCGIKFASYDACKDLCKNTLLADPEGKPSALHRAVSGGLAGVFAQTFVYPVDVIRRRLQTGGPEAAKKYSGFISALWRLYTEEGFRSGLYRGLSLNYMKTVPNTTVYLALFDTLMEYAQS